jgi:hypothetical protein
VEKKKTDPPWTTFGENSDPTGTSRWNTFGENSENFIRLQMRLGACTHYSQESVGRERRAQGAKTATQDKKRRKAAFGHGLLSQHPMRVPR